MEEYNIKVNEFFDRLGNAKKMVLSTSFKDEVSSRMMSLVIINHCFYFQNDSTFRKYHQLKNNSHVSLCIDNIQIEGVSEELGHPLENAEFSEQFKKNFVGSYNLYTNLKNERLFKITPNYIKLWIYENKTPYTISFNFEDQTVKKEKYIGE